MQKPKEIIKKAGDSLKAGAKNLADSAKSAVKKTKDVISATKTKTSNLLQKLGVANLHPISAISDQDIRSFVIEKLDLIVKYINRTDDYIQVGCQYEDKNVILYLEDYKASATFENSYRPNKFERTLANEISQKWTFLLYQNLGKRYLKNLCSYNNQAKDLEIDSD